MPNSLAHYILAPQPKTRVVFVLLEFFLGCLGCTILCRVRQEGHNSTMLVAPDVFLWSWH
jgi:hypothetical protein